LLIENERETNQGGKNGRIKETEKAEGKKKGFTKASALP